MQEWAEKLLLVAAGAAVGALGYMAWQNRDELHALLDKALDHGQEMVKSQIKDFEQHAASGPAKEA